MSSSGYHPPHLQQLHSHGKRPFEECGDYDPEMPIQQSSGTSSSSSNKNKRARSTSSTSTNDSPASSSGYNTAPSDTAHDVRMSDLPTQPPPPQDTFRTSLQRFAEFDRQIAALRTSLAATRSPPLPSDGDPAPSNFLSSGSSALSSASSGPASSTVAVVPPSTFAFSTDTPNVTTASTSFSTNYSNSRYPPLPSYHPSVGASSSLVERTGDATPPLMRPSANEHTARSSVPVESSAHTRRALSPLILPPDPSSSSSSPSSIFTDDSLSRYRALFGSRNPANGRSHRNTDGLPANLETSEPPRAGLSPQVRLGDRVRVMEHSVERESVPSVFDVFNMGGSSQERSRSSPARDPAPSHYTSATEPAVPPRVPGSHGERSRGPTPITAALNANPVTSQDPHSRNHSSWASIPSSNSLMSESASERRQAHAFEQLRARRSSVDADDESDSFWSGSPRGRDLGRALPVRPSLSLESVSGTSSHVSSFGATRAPSTTNRTESMASASLQRSFSDFIEETQQLEREDAPEVFFLGWDVPRVAERERERDRLLDRDRQRDRVWGRERHSDQPTQDVRGRGFASGSSLASTSSAREEFTHVPVPMPGPTQLSLAAFGSGSSSTHATSTNRSQQYSYSNLNLSSFQSGLFRDSLRRNAEVDQGSNGLGLSYALNSADGASRISLEDSGSEMILGDIVPSRSPSPEWSRPQPYAGRTPPPDYSPPPRNFSLRPGLAALRRGSIASHDSPPRNQNANRHSMAFPWPMPAMSLGPTRPNSYENNSRPVPPERTDRDRFLPTRILESLYRSHDDGGRRNQSVGTGQAYHAHPTSSTHHVLATPTASRNERSQVAGPRSASGNGVGGRPGEAVAENRRSSFGSLRSRLARFASPQAFSNATEVSSRQRSPSHPIGARPQGVDQHRRGSSLSGANVVQEPRGSGPLHWIVNAGTPEPSSVQVTREVPWRAVSGSGSRSAFVPPPPPVGSSVEPATRVEERSRPRTFRQRLHLDRNGSEGVRVFRPMLRAAMGRRGNLGDYVPDDLFDDSYEALLSLSNMLGEVRSRATPEEVISSLPTGTFKEWKKADSETRCPICLDDYEPLDIVTKLIECPHWLHKHCLEQWLRTANTCPVCREKVKASPKPAPARRRPVRDVSGPSGTNQSSSTSGSGASGRPSYANAPSNHGRPVSFAAFVSDDNAESWPASSLQATPAARDPRTAFLEHLRTQQTQRTSQAHVPPFPPPHRVAPTAQAGPSSGVGVSGTDGRSLGFAMARGPGLFLDTQMMGPRENMQGPSWRNARLYDAVFNEEASTLASRIPVEEDSPMEDVFDFRRETL